MARRPSTDLFELVRALTPAERGYVHKTLTRPLGRDPRGMLALFEAMSAADRPDHESINAVIAEAGAGASQLKRLLFDHLLRTLRSLDSVRDPRVAVLALMQDGTLLLERALPTAARERFEQAEQRAQELHAFSLHADALQALIKIERLAGQPNDPERLTKLRAARAESLQCATDVAALSQVSATLFEATRASGVQDIARETLRHPLVAASSVPHVRLRFWQHHVRAMAYHVLDDEASQDASLAVMISIMQDHPIFLAEDNAITVLANIVTTRLHRHDAPGAREALTLMERITPSSPRMEDELWYNTARGMMYVLLIEGRDDDVIAQKDRMADGRDQYPIHGEVVWRTWRLLAATAMLRRGELEHARTLAVSILDERDLPDHQYIAPRVQELLCLVGEGDVELALYRARSFEHAFRSTRSSGSVAHAIVRHVKGLARGGSTAQQAAVALRELAGSQPPSRTDRTLLLTLQAASTFPLVVDRVMAQHLQRR